MIRPFGSIDVPGGDAPDRDAVPCDQSSYPGGKSGAGIYQRLINLIPRHRILIVAFAGQCGVARHILPAEHTIIIDQDPKVCQWWDSWRRSPGGRSIEIHNCDAIEWLRYRFSLTEYSAVPPRGAGRMIPRPAIARGSASHLVGPHKSAASAAASQFDGAGPPPEITAEASATLFQGAASRPEITAEAFTFCDPPYVLSERAHGKQYACELTDADHLRLLDIVTSIPAARSSIMVCGYACPLYAALDPWRAVDHRVPTRGGLQDERIWMNYGRPSRLHDYRYVGKCRRSRERIRRRQRNWVSQLQAMSDREREAMLASLERCRSPHEPRTNP